MVSRFVARTLVFYNDDDWKFEDEDDDDDDNMCTTLRAGVGVGIVAAAPHVGFDIIDGHKKTDGLLPRTFGRQLSIDANTIDRELFASGAEKYPSAWSHNTRVSKLRFRVHKFIDHILIRLFTLLAVITDIVVTLVAVFDKNDARRDVYSIVTLIAVSYFMIEVLLRMYAWGRQFFHHRLEVIDFLATIITFFVTVTLESLQYYGKGRYASLIVGFRVVRIGLYLKLFYGVWESIRVAARNLVGQNKRRYVRDGYNLDLTYITDRVIAMSFPSSGLIASYRNPIHQVAKFFREKHHDHFRIYNLCSERHYDTSHFDEHVERLMIDDHNVPRMSELLRFCEDVETWMNADTRNVVAIHCKGGKGRTGTCIAAWLLYSGQIKTADKALLYFGERRTDMEEGVTFQGVETPSQIRYVQYLERILTTMDRKMPADRPLNLLSLKIYALKGVGNEDGSDISFQIIMDGKVIHEGPITGRYKKSRDMIVKKFLPDDGKILRGDVKFRFLSRLLPEDYDRCAFFFWLHTSFVGSENKFVVKREEIGNCHKPKYHRIYRPGFSISLTFTEPLTEVVTV